MSAPDGRLPGEADLAIDSVTGVDVSLPIAGAGGRTYAFVIDWHIRSLVALAWWLAVSFAYGGLTMLNDGLEPRSGYFMAAVLPALAIYILYHPVLEIAMHGRTPGKRMAGVRIVTREGATPGVGALLIRNVFRLVDSLPAFYCLGLAVAIFSAQHVRIGDLAAGTLLIYDRDAALPDPDKQGAGAMDQRLVELIEDVVSRWKELDPQARMSLGHRILTRADPTGAEIDTPQDMLARLQAVLSRAR